MRARPTALRPSDADPARRRRVAAFWLPAVAIAVALAATLAGTARAADFPARKPGLWELAMQPDGGAKSPAMTTQQCIDAASDKAMREVGMGMNKDMCSKQDVRSEGGRLVVDSVCKMGSTTATTHAVVSGDFASAYRMESRSTYSPPLMGRAEGSAVIEARWVGPCKAGQKPGDVVMPGGVKMNMLDMMGARK